MSGIVGSILGALSELPGLILTLGEVAFYDQEVPSSLSGGGTQMLGEHKYPGGVRTADAFGPDDAELAWSGTFVDLAAEARCHQVDAMRRFGVPVPLTWSSFSYAVIIKSFTWTYERTWQIRYQISLFVVQDLLFPPDDGDAESFDQQASNDAGAAAGNTYDYGPQVYNYPDTAPGQADYLTAEAGYLQSTGGVARIAPN